MQVFISYAAQDRELARQLGSQLVQAGLQVWNPEREILPGDNWASKTGQALDESDIMVAVVTRHALESGSLKQDIQYALTSGSYEGRVVPVLVDQVTFEAGKDVPWILLQLDPVYLESGNGSWEKVVQRVKSLAEAGAHAAR